MDYRGQRPPRSARPPGQDQPPQPPTQSPPPSYPAYPAYSQYPDQPASATTYRPPYPGALGEQPRGISFQNTEVGDRHYPLDQHRQRHYSAYQTSPPPMDVESGYGDGRVLRKKSLVRPDREKIDPHHRQWHYRNHAAQMLDEGGEALPSSAYTIGLFLICFCPSPHYLRCSHRKRASARSVAPWQVSPRS